MADFGSSKLIVESANMKSFCGTPYWMAPEVITAKGVNRFADIWSLGCTVYEMISKNPPWKSKNVEIFGVFQKIAGATKPPKYPKGISASLTDFLNCCFKTVPHERANVYELLKHPFITRDQLIKPLADKHSL